MGKSANVPAVYNLKHILMGTRCPTKQEGTLYVVSSVYRGDYLRKTIKNNEFGLDVIRKDEECFRKKIIKR